MASTSWQTGQSCSSMQWSEKEETHHWAQTCKRNVKLLHTHQECYQTKTTRRFISHEDSQPRQHPLGIHIQTQSPWRANTETTSQTLLTSSRNNLHPWTPSNTNQQWMHQQFCQTSLSRNCKSWRPITWQLHQRSIMPPKNQGLPNGKPSQQPTHLTAMPSSKALNGGQREPPHHPQDNISESTNP